MKYYVFTIEYFPKEADERKVDFGVVAAENYHEAVNKIVFDYDGTTQEATIGGIVVEYFGSSATLNYYELKAAWERSKQLYNMVKGDEQ